MKKTAGTSSSMLKAIAIVVLIGTVLIIGMGYLNSYIGYYGYNKHLYRRFSHTIEESKLRGVFVKEITFITEPDSLAIQHVFIERGYRWGSSYKKTRDLDPNGRAAAYPYQVVVSNPDSLNGEPIRIVLTSSVHGKQYFEPIADIELPDTIKFNVNFSSIDHHGSYGKILVLPTK